MPNNLNLQEARKAKNDEFYTDLHDIEQEMCNYKDKFKEKVVFCNCDDPFESNFVKFFLMHFNDYGLKALYAFGYKVSIIANKELQVKQIPYRLYVQSTKEYLQGDQTDLDVRSLQKFIKERYEEIEEYFENDKYRFLSDDVIIKPVYDDDMWLAGDFRSQQSIEILKKSDIVVTNPPFSLFREYIAQLMKYNKQFIIMGNQNAITYKETFKLIKDNKLWLGASIHNGDREFRVPNDYVASKNYRYDEKGYKYVRVRGPRWFTNVDYEARHKYLPLDLGCSYQKYSEQYPKYDNYDAINVDKTSEIPYDYNGCMGVPITFMDKYCPEQFEIVGIGIDYGEEFFIPTKKYENPVMIKSGKESNGSNINKELVYKAKGNEKVVYRASNVDYLLFAPYARILIKRK